VQIVLKLNKFFSQFLLKESVWSFFGIFADVDDFSQGKIEIIYFFEFWQLRFRENERFSESS